MTYNPILSTDSYKFSHFMQYPKGTTGVCSYIEARGSQILGVTETVFAGLQPYIVERLLTPITMEQVEQADAFCQKHGTPFNRAGWERIVKVHNGFLPVRIFAVPEGSVVPLRNVLLQITNNDQELPWLTSYLETDLLRHVWYASTVATLSREIKKVIKSALDKTSDNPEEELPFKLHDFGFRGVSSFETAAAGGFAHLINFMGTDTVAGIEYAMKYYDADVCGYSISASEHSTMTSWTRAGEYDAYKNMVDSYAKPGATFACVIDSYDTMNAIKLWAEPQHGNKSLLEQVKEAGATVVLRPDSGDPVEMPIDVIRALMRHVGYTTNSKGYRVLPNYVRVIQGDGIDINDVKTILANMEYDNISASNIAFGMGGGLLQKVNRDTFKFAMKCNAIMFDDGLWRDVRKDPTTDTSKKSKAGPLVLLLKDGAYETRHQRDVTPAEMRHSAMHRVYDSQGGRVFAERITMDEVRKNAEVK